MGVVYRAHDTRLDRAVAVKMILDSGADQNGRKRFLREAQAAARVNHPNVCRLYDIGEDSGRPFLVMEMLEGESLAARLTRGSVTLPEAIQITLSILSALGALHQHSIVHRDLKPSNVFLSSEGVKLLDFGLAKPVTPDVDEVTNVELTQPGMIAATPRYASPEQLTGKPVDGRSDLFSAGTILFEMVSGKLAFGGDSAVQIFHAILYETPPALSGSSSVTAVDRILRRAFAKNPEERYQSAEEMANELRAVMRVEDSSAHVEARTVKRLMVLPFRALRPDPDTDFLAFSLPEAIAASLSGLNSLVVRSSIAAARYAAAAPDLKEIAREAEVDVVLTGTLLRAGTQLRLTTQLVEAPAGTLIWSRQAQSELGDIFQLQDSLVSDVVESLSLPLTAGERQLLSRDAPASASAYDLYLRANELARDTANMAQAIELYQQTVAKDPQYAPAWARLGRVLWLNDKYASASGDKILEADRAMRRALELSPDLALAHQYYTPIQIEQGHVLEALRRLSRRIRSSRTDAELFAGLTHACRYCGLLEESVEAHEQARRLDPAIATSVLHTKFMMGDYESALKFSQQDYGYGMPLALTMLGRVDEALDVLRTKEPARMYKVGILYMDILRGLLEGRREDALRASEELMNHTFRDPEGWYYLGRQLAYLGAPDRALYVLSTAVDMGFFAYPTFLRDPWLDSLRAQAEFRRILEKARLHHQEALEIFKSEGGETLLGRPALSR